MTHERIGPYITSTLDTSDFDQLPAALQHVVYNLHMSGLIARNLRFFQFGRHNIALKELLKAIVENPSTDENVRAIAKNDLLLFFASGGMYYDTIGTRIQFQLKESDFDEAIYRTTLPHHMTWMIASAKKALYGASYTAEPTTAQHNLSANTSLIAANLTGDEFSPSGFETGLIDRVTLTERKSYIAGKTLQQERDGQKQCQYGINLFLGKDEQGYKERRFSKGDIFSSTLTHVVSYLNKAIEHADGYPLFQDSIRTLIEFYETGDPQAYLRHEISWMKGTDCPVFYTHGFVETYDDPLKKLGSFQCLVGVENKIKTEQTKDILKLSTYIEQSLPTDPKFKRADSNGTSGASVSLLSYSGCCAPVLPAGCLLPNTAWVRSELGSRSTPFDNVIEARGMTDALLPLFISPDSIHAVKKYATVGQRLHINLHEAVGHASGQIMSGVSHDALGLRQKTIEEARADLVAYCCFGDEWLIKQLLPDVDDHKEFLTAMYELILTQSAWIQLYKIDDAAAGFGAAEHMKSRALVSGFVIESGLHSRAIRIEHIGQSRYIRVDDPYAVHSIFCDMLREIQRITSVGHSKASELLCQRYVDHIDIERFEYVKEKTTSSDIARYVCFLTPQITPTGDNDTPYRIGFSNSFWDDQMELERYALMDDFTAQLCNY